MLKNEYFINYNRSKSSNLAGNINIYGNENSALEKSFLNFMPKNKLEETITSLKKYLTIHIGNKNDLELSSEDKFLSRFYCLFNLISMDQSNLSDLLNFGAIINTNTNVENYITISLDMKRFRTLNLFETNFWRYNINISFSYDDKSIDTNFNVEMNGDLPNITMNKDLMLFLHKTQKHKVYIDEKNVFFLDAVSKSLDDVIMDFYNRLESYTTQFKLSLDSPLKESIYI